jgi:DnaJ-class molecular chaperone
MERKTYYMVLGVSRSESANGIRARYRFLAKKLHPDVAGEQATRAFQEVSEAYNVLSDPERRREYNRGLSRAENDEAIPVVNVRGQPRTIVGDPVTILGNPESLFPSFEAVYERFLRNFTGLGVPKSEQVEGLGFEVLLTRQEALHGCVVPVGVPVFRRCPQCGGSARDGVSACSYCRQQGLVETEEIVGVRIPPLPASGSVFELPLGGLGIHNFRVCLHVFVEPHERGAHATE